MAVCLATQTSCALTKDNAPSVAPVVSIPVAELPSPTVMPTKVYTAELCPTVMSLGQNVSDIAREQLGVRYRRGGASPHAGFDCSGFVYWVFAKHGVQVPRDSVRLSSAGHEVSKNDLLPGDILIFRIPRTPNGRHTAIYIGEGRFIHSPTSGSRVRIEKLSDSYWQKHYYTARRVLKAPPCDLDIYTDPSDVNSQLSIGDLSASIEGPTSR